MLLVPLPMLVHVFELMRVTAEFRDHPSVVRNPCQSLNSRALLAAIKVDTEIGHRT